MKVGIQRGQVYCQAPNNLKVIGMQSELQNGRFLGKVLAGLYWTISIYHSNRLETADLDVIVIEFVKF